MPPAVSPADQEKAWTDEIAHPAKVGCRPRHDLQAPRPITDLSLGSPFSGGAAESHRERRCSAGSPPVPERGRDQILATVVEVRDAESGQQGVDPLGVPLLLLVFQAVQVLTSSRP